MINSIFQIVRELHQSLKILIKVQHAHLHQILQILFILSSIIVDGFQFFNIGNSIHVCLRDWWLANQLLLVVEIFSKFRIRKENFRVKIFIQLIFFLFNIFLLALVWRFDFEFLVFIVFLFLFHFNFFDFDWFI